MKVTRFKTLLSYLPEASFIVMALVWFLDNLLASPSYFNIPMLGIIVFIVALVIWRIKAFAITLSAILGLASFYMILAVISEFNEFPKGDPESYKLLITGLAIFLSLVAMSVVLPIKYFRKPRLS